MKIVTEIHINMYYSYMAAYKGRAGQAVLSGAQGRDGENHQTVTTVRLKDFSFSSQRKSNDFHVGLLERIPKHQFCFY